MGDETTYYCTVCGEEFTEAQEEGFEDDRCPICGGELEWY